MSNSQHGLILERQSSSTQNKPVEHNTNVVHGEVPDEPALLLSLDDIQPALELD